jgi:ubiquinone/menaquinone biosynthesis C-methylase UbiE
MSQTQSNAKEYVLGTGADELARLGLQHRLWSDAAHSLWRRAQIRLGQRVLDVGCGPGFAALDMAQMVGVTGAVVGVDESAPYISHLTSQAQSRSLPHCRGAVGDVQHLGDALGAERPFDLAYARWVMCFVPDPESVVAGVSRALRPGGRFCVQDYFNYGMMSMAPKRPSHDKAVAATIKSWQARGGDTDIMGRLPRLLAKHRMRVVHLDVHLRIARSGDTMFHWPDVWWRIYAPKLVQMGYLAQADQDELFRDLDEIAASDTDFILCPPVFEIIAEKD